MAASKKKAKREKELTENYISQERNPDLYYSSTPAWTFENADKEMRAFSKERKSLRILKVGVVHMLWCKNINVAGG